ncbi:class I SAM-dependent methyltransferase [Bradyrhizobium sp. SYSU BS000235]|uniref:class I SAM-dependent methyltransferase n=1 Tax=Bradyrhizobium sp. SYSU BS000235 TaxID=3411332 RepID=UPI003C7319AD
MEQMLTTKPDLEDRDGIKILKSQFSDPNPRMGEIVDWRARIQDPSLNPSHADFIFRKFVYEQFYSQYSNLLSASFGENFKNAVVLDIGCGDCFGVESWVSGCKEFHGLDIMPDQLSLARKYLPVDKFPHVNLYQVPVTADLFEPGFADCVISSEVIEHLDDPIEHVRRLCEWVKPGGLVCISTPCPMLYLYPSQLFPLLKNSGGRGFLRKALNAADYWEEMLPAHPALRPHVLRSWLEKEELSEFRQWSCLFQLETQWSLKFSRFLEGRGWSIHLPLFERFLRFKESLPMNVSVLKMIGTRQFIVGRKPR